MDWGRQDPGPPISALFSSWSPSLPLPLRASAMTFEVEGLPVRGRLWTARNWRAEGLGQHSNRSKSPLVLRDLPSPVPT